MKTRRGRTAVRLLASTSLLTGVLVVAQDSSVVHAAQFTYVPDVLYMGANGTTTPELAPPVTIPPKLPYIVDVPDGTMPFDGEEDPITGYLRKIEVETEENVAQCNASRAAEPIGYSGCSSVKLNVSHGDLPVGGTSAHDDDPDVQVHSGGAYVDVTFDNDDTYEVYIRGLNDEINAALADLSYVPNADHYHTGEPNDIERLDVLLSTWVGSVDGNSTRSTFIRVMDVNDWPEIEAPPDTDVNAGEAVVFGEVPAPGDEEDFTKYTGDRFEITDEDNDDGTDEDDDDEGDEPKRDGPHDDLLVVMWTTCGSFEITNKNTFSVSEHIEELIGEFFATMGADIDDPIIEGAMATVEQALVDALGQAGLDDTLLATETEWGAGERVGAFAGLAENLPGVIDAFDEVTFFAREPGPSNAGAYLDDTSCDLYAFTSDLGNSGLPVQFFSYYTGSHDIVLPWPAFHWDSVNIEILEAREIEIGFEPSDPIFVNEADAPTPVEAPVVISPGDHPGFSFEWSAVPGTATPVEDYSGTSNNNPTVPPGVILLPFPGDADNSFVDAPGTTVFATGGPGEGIETFDLVMTLPNPAPPGWTFSPQALTRTVVILEDDTTGPAVVINQAAAQDDPTSSLPIEFDVYFSEEVSGFTASDVDVELDGVDIDSSNVTIVGSAPGSSYVVQVAGLTASGLVTAEIPAGAAVGASGTSAASVSSDNEVTYDFDEGDVTAPTVTIEQGAAQSDPTDVSPVVFDVVFSEPVTDFENVDVVLSGTALPTTAVVVPVTASTYRVEVSGMSVDGLVVAEVVAAAAEDAAGNLSEASVSSDNEVTYDFDEGDVTAPTVTIEQGAAQSDPTDVSPVVFDVVFSEPVTDFENVDVVLSGTALPTTAVVVPVTASTYRVEVSGMSVDGLVVAEVVAAAAEDAAGNLSEASTSVDNEVTYDFDAPTNPAVIVTAQTPVASTEPVVFDVEFTEDVTGFSDNVTDVVLGGTAAPTSAVISVVDGNSYTVAVSGMSNSGTVTLRVPAAAAAALDDSSPSQISNIASAQYNMQPPQDSTPPVPVVTAVTPSPTSASPVVFTVQFSEPVVGFVTGEATAGGTAGANAATVAPVDADTYTVTVTGMGVAGTVTLMVAAGVTEDAAGNLNLASNTATVQWAPAPGPLTITVPSNIVRPNDPGQAGAVVIYPAATASGGVPPTTVTCSSASGAFYPLGTTTVTCTAVDSESGQPDVFTEATVTASFTITVNDTEPPVIATPPDLTRTTTGGNPVSVTFDLPAASDNSGVPPTVTCTRPTVSSYTLGVSSITCTATDGSGNTASSSFTVTVVSQDPGSGPAAPRSPSGTLPATGTGATRLATVAAATLFAGVVLLLARWRGATSRLRV